MSANGKSTSTIELVAFRIGEQEFCVDIMCVREIRGWTPATALPHAPAFVRGVINLRGSVLPIVDLGVRLGLARLEDHPRNVIIVVQVGKQILGLQVNGVSDILTVDASSIQPAPEIGSEPAMRSVRGLLALEGRLINLIGLDDVLPMQTEEAV